MALTLDGTTGISATGNIYGNNIIVTNSLTAGTFSPTSLSATGNVTGGNLVTAGLITATANITGGNLVTAGQLISSVVTGTAPLSVTSTTLVPNLYVARANVSDWDAISTATTGTYYVMMASAVTGNVQNSANSAITVNAATGALQSTIISATANVIGGNVTTGGLISATSTITSAANITGGNLLTGGLISATSTITSAANITGGNILTAGLMSSTGNAIHGNVLTGGYISATGNMLGNVFTVNLGNTANAIINGGANGVGNIGTATSYFNTVFGKATTAQYADLAELYSADAKYDPGTVLVFGGNNEVTISTVSADPRVAGVVSTNPAHLMNSVLDSEHRVAVALTGRVPTSVTGTVRKGDMMVTANNGLAQACATPAMGTVIGKALENFDGASGTIEVVVGRL